MKNSEFIDLWAGGFIYDFTTNNNLSGDFYKLFSYGTCIAERQCNIGMRDYYILNRTKYSNTTTHHQNMLVRALKNDPTLSVCNVPRGEKSLNIGEKDYQELQVFFDGLKYKRYVGEIVC